MLVASDGRNENSTRVVVHVLDVNDRPPTFSRSAYVTQALEETGPYPHPLIQVFYFILFLFGGGANDLFETIQFEII